MSEECLSTKINNACHASRIFQNYVNCQFVSSDSERITHINEFECYRLPVVELYATRPIHGGEELLLDYGRGYKSP
jgi:hypothetical protein